VEVTACSWFCMGKQFDSGFGHCDLARPRSIHVPKDDAGPRNKLLTRGSGHIYILWEGFSTAKHCQHCQNTAKMSLNMCGDIYGLLIGPRGFGSAPRAHGRQYEARKGYIVDCALRALDALDGLGGLPLDGLLTQELRWTRTWSQKIMTVMTVPLSPRAAASSHCRTAASSSTPTPSRAVKFGDAPSY